MSDVIGLRSAARVGEQRLLAELLDVLLVGPQAARLGPGDDAAVLALASDAVLTVDSVVAGQDWLPDETPPDAVGHRAAAVNLSDLAAMGATPRGVLLALELGRRDDVDDVLEAAAGFGALCRAHGVDVLGGDIGIGEGPQRWTVTAVGSAGPRLLRRDAARVGHRVWLVGHIGQAALGLQALLRDARDPLLQACVRAHLRPTPQVAAGQALSALDAPVAAIDISDGLWLDAARLAQASGVSLCLDVPRPGWLSPPLADLLRELNLDWREACASGGDDYALLVTAPWDCDLAATLAGVAPTVAIGEVTRSEGGERVQLDVGSRRLVGAPRGWLHGAPPEAAEPA